MELGRAVNSSLAFRFRRKRARMKLIESRSESGVHHDLDFGREPKCLVVSRAGWSEQRAKLFFARPRIPIRCAAMNEDSSMASLLCSIVFGCSTRQGNASIISINRPIVRSGVGRDSVEIRIGFTLLTHSSVRPFNWDHTHTQTRSRWSSAAVEQQNNNAQPAAGGRSRAERTREQNKATANK